MLKRHTKPSAQNKQGGIVEKEGMLSISNVLLVCDKCGKGVRIKRKKLDDGKRVRVCVKCGEVIDKG
jgi:large subunit ribosomal protein L24